jgi:6-phosphogluconolactonase (cycloisomerase 2 family)
VSNASTSVTVALGTNPAGGTLSGTTAVAAVSGVAVFSNLILDKSGTGYTLTAAATDLTGTTSSPFDVTPIPRKLAFVVQPSTTLVSGAITPAVQVAVQDEKGNTVSSASTNVTVAIGNNPAGGTLSGTITVAAVRGVAVFSNLFLDKRGIGYTLTAGASGLTGATSGPFVVASSIPGCLNLSAPLPFGLQTIGTSGATRALTLTNPCTGVPQDLAGGAVVNGYNWQDFSLTSNCPPVLGPGVSCTYDVTFRPTGPGERSGYLIVNRDLPNAVEATLEGTAIGALAASVAPDPSSVSGGFTYVANANANSVSMYRIDRATGVLAPLVPPAIPAGTNPASVAVDPSGKFAYVANAGSNSISMYRIDAGGLLASIGPPVASGTLPISVAVAPDPAGGPGRFAYVANAHSNDVSMYRIAPVTGALTWLGTMAVGTAPWFVAVHPSGKFAYVASPNGWDGNTRYINSAVYAYAINDNGVLTPAGLTTTGAQFPSSLAVDPSGKFIALTNQGSTDMYVWNIDPMTGALVQGLRTFLADQKATSLAISVLPSGEPFAYVTYGPGFFASTADNSVLTYDIGNKSNLAGAAATGKSPTSIAIDPTGRFAYVANSGSGDVSMYGINADGTLKPLVPGTIGI